MFQRFLVPSALVSLVSIPAYLVGQHARHGEGSVFGLAAMTLIVVLLASEILRRNEAK